jgi:hypothetical protein
VLKAPSYKARKPSASNGLRAFFFSEEIFRYLIGPQPAPLLVLMEIHQHLIVAASAKAALFSGLPFSSTADKRR